MQPTANTCLQLTLTAIEPTVSAYFGSEIYSSLLKRLPLFIFEKFSAHGSQASVGFCSSFFQSSIISPRVYITVNILYNFEVNILNILEILQGYGTYLGVGFHRIP